MEDVINISKFEYERLHHLGEYSDYKNHYKTCKVCNETYPNTDKYFLVNKTGKKLKNICIKCFLDFYNSREEKEKRDLQKKIRQIRNQYKISLKNNTQIDFTLEDWEECKAYFKNECCYCGKETFLTQDHIIPIANNGTYTKNNIIPACKSCNSSKNKRDLVQWYKKQDYFQNERLEKIYQWVELNK